MSSIAIVPPLGATQDGQNGVGALPTPRGEASVVGVGARASIGMSALQVALAVRAGKLQARDSHLVGKSGAPIAIARVPSIGDTALGEERYVPLAAPALTEAATPWHALRRATAQHARPLPLVVALPVHMRRRVERNGHWRDVFLEELAHAAGVPLDVERSTFVVEGRAGGVEALRIAVGRLASAQDEAIVVGGVDSLFDPDALDALDAQGRVYGPDAENGVLPGEGAAFIVLTAPGRAPSLARYARVGGVSVEQEPRPYGSLEPCHALGITLATRRCLEASGAAAKSVPWLVTDVMDERHRVEEWLYAEGRVQPYLQGEPPRLQPLLCTGELGAAAAPMMLAVVAQLWAIGATAHPAALFAAHSDGSLRGAFLARKEGE